MKRPDKPPREAEPMSLAQASTALELELRRFEELCRAACKVPLDSQKNIERASKLGGEAAESQERFGEHLRALVAAVGSARDRQQANADALHARAGEIRARSARYDELVQRFAGLGAQASSIQERVQRAAALQRESSGPEGQAEVAGVLDEVVERMSGVADEATGLAKTAADEGVHDLARQADSLRQQVLHARNRVRLLRANLKEG